MTTKTTAEAFADAVEKLDAKLEAIEKPARRLSRDDILGAQDQETEDVYVPQWDGTVTIRSLTGFERDQYEASLVSYDRDAQGRPQVKAIELDNLRARLVSLVVIDEKGERLFRSKADVFALGEKNANALDLLFQAAQSLSGLTQPAIEAAKEAMAKVPNDEPGSDSPGILG
jgi:hypothetical protein